MQKITVINKENYYHDQRFASPERYNNFTFIHD